MCPLPATTVMSKGIQLELVKKESHLLWYGHLLVSSLLLHTLNGSTTLTVIDPTNGATFEKEKNPKCLTGYEP